MKKIFDWTVGSFFRTIGRTIAFFAMALLVYYLLSYNDIDFGIKNLFFDKVKASIIDSGDRLYQNTLFGNCDKIKFNGSTPFENNSGGLMCKQSYSQQGGSFFNYIEFNLTLNQNYDYLVIPITVNIESTSQVDSRVLVNNIQFTGWEGIYQPLYYEVVNQFSHETQNSNMSSNITILYNIYIDVKTYQTFGRLYMSLENALLHSYTVNYYIGTDVYYIKGSTSSIIDNQNQNSQQIINATQQQTQQQQQQHQETMNSSTTDAENDASSFFGNFTVEDQGGLSAIVTAPLNTIRSLLSSTCADLVLPLPFVEEDLTLPCMYSIYTEHFGAFFSLYQTIILGIIAYRCIMSIFFDIKGFTNPNDDRIEVMDL